MPTDYQALFGDDFLKVLDALDELTPELEAILLSAMDQMVYDTTVFGARLEQSIVRMEALGVSKEVIFDTLQDDMQTGGRIFGELKNNAKAAIVGAINLASRLGQYQNYDLDKGQFAWVTVGGHKVCPDCDGREGIIMNFNNWESAGLPGSGWSICQGWCYCVLDPTGEIKTKIDIDLDKRS